MPVVAVGVAAGVGAAAAGVTVAGLTVAATAVAVGVATAVGSQLLTDAMTPELGSYETDPVVDQALQTQGNLNRKIVYGEALTGAQIVGYAQPTIAGKDYHLMVLHLIGHPCERVELYEIEGKKQSEIANKIQLNIHLGDQKEVDSLAYQYIDGWTQEHIGYNQTYVVLKAEIDPDVFPSGINDVKFKVKGKRVYDPRKDNSIGGEGWHRLNDKTTWEWSDNPVLCGYNWLLEHGAKPVPSRRIPTEFCATAANYCDELATYRDAQGNEKQGQRFAVNGILNNGLRPGEGLNQILATMGGKPYRVGGKIYLKPAMYAGPATTTIHVKETKDFPSYEPHRPYRDLLNTVRAEYIEPDLKWQVTGAPVVDSPAYKAQDGAHLESVIRLNLVTKGHQAQRLGKLKLERSRAGFIAKYSLPGIRLDVVAGNNIVFIDEQTGINKEFLVEDAKYNAAKRTTDLILIEDSQAIYPDGFEPAEVELTPNTTLPDSLNTPPSNLSATAIYNGAYQVKLAWQNPYFSTVVRLRQLREDDPINAPGIKTEYVIWERGTTDNTMFLSGLEPGDYLVDLQALNRFGRTSGWLLGQPLSVRAQPENTWVIYADDKLGTNPSYLDTSKPYIGYQFNKVAARFDIETVNMTDFAWFKNAASEWLLGDGPPAEDLGEKDYTYVNQANGNIYKKTAQGWGDPVGNLSGADGDKWLSGQNEPDPASGADGFWYIKLSTYDIYLKVNGTWEPRGNIKGPPGPAPTVEDLGNGSYKITGANGSIIIRDGNDGAIPTLIDNQDGTYTIRNENGEEIIVRDGADGKTPVKGIDYIDGLNGDYVSFIYRNSANQPAKPTGGSFNGSTETFPTGASDTPTTPSAGEKRWVASVRYKNNKDGTWTRRTAWSDYAPHYEKGEKGQAGDDGLTADAITGRAGQQWGFGDDSLQGWSLRNYSNHSINQGRVTLVASSHDTGIYNSNLYLEGNESYALRVRVRTQSLTHDTTAELYWATKDGHGYDNNYRLSQAVTYKKGEWWYLIFDLRDTPDWLNSIITGLRIDFANSNASGKQYQIDGIVVGYFGSPEEQDGEELVNPATNLITNAKGKIADRHGRAAGWKPISGGYDYDKVRYYAGHDALRVGTPSYEKQANGFKAISLNPNNVYRVRLELSCEADHDSGLFIRMEEYEGLVRGAKTHVGDLDGAGHVQERSRVTTFYNDGAITREKKLYEFFYQPVPSVKYGTLSVYRWDGIPTNHNVWIHHAEISAVEAGDELRNDRLSKNNIRQGAGWSTLPADAANRALLDSDSNVPGRARVRYNNGSWEYIDVYSSSERGQINNLRGNRLSDGKGYLLDRDMAYVNSNGQSYIDGRANTRISTTVNGSYVDSRMGWSNRPANGANKTEIGNYNDEGVFQYRYNDGGWATMAPYSTSARSQINNLRGNRFSDGSRYMLDRDMAYITGGGQNYISGRVDARRPDSYYRNSNTSKSDVGLSRVDNVSQSTMLNNAYQNALASELLRNPSGEGVNFFPAMYCNPLEDVPFGSRNSTTQIGVTSYDYDQPSKGTVISLDATGDDAWANLSVTTFNIKAPPNRKWIISFWVSHRSSEGGSNFKTNVYLVYRNSNNNPSHAGASYRVGERYAWQRRHVVIDMTGSAERRQSDEFCLRLDNDGGNGASLRFDQIMIEMVDPARDDGNYKPSPYVLPFGMRPIFDPTVLPSFSTAGAGSTVSRTPLDSSIHSGSGRITIRSHTRYTGGKAVSYSQDTIDGLAYSTRYYVYADDPYYQGGNPGYHAVTANDFTRLSQNVGRVWFGSRSTPSSGGSYGGGGGSSGGGSDFNCVDAAMWLREGLQAEDVKAGDELDGWSPERGFETMTVRRCPTAIAFVYRLVTKSGAETWVSESTPIDLEDGRQIRAEHALEEKLLTQHENGESQWEQCVICEPMGPRKVVKINCGDTSYLSGVTPYKRIVTHNVLAKP